MVPHGGTKSAVSFVQSITLFHPQKLHISVFFLWRSTWAGVRVCVCVCYWDWWMSISNPVSTFQASLWSSIFCQIRHYACFYQSEGTVMDIDTKNIFMYLRRKLPEEEGIIAFYDKYNWWHDINAHQSHWFGEKCQSKCHGRRLW